MKRACRRSSGLGEAEPSDERKISVESTDEPVLVGGAPAARQLPPHDPRIPQGGRRPFGHAPVGTLPAPPTSDRARRVRMRSSKERRLPFRVRSHAVRRGRSATNAVTPAPGPTPSRPARRRSGRSSPWLGDPRGSAQTAAPRQHSPSSERLKPVSRWPADSPTAKPPPPSRYSGPSHSRS